MSTVVEQARLLPLPEAATRLGVSVITLRRRIADGTISAVRIGPSDRHPLRVSEDELHRFISNSPSGEVSSDDGSQRRDSFASTRTPPRAAGPPNVGEAVEPAGERGGQ